MTAVRKRIIIALIAALPIELVNFFLFPAPIDVGPAPDASLFERFMFTQWVLLHLPGLWFSDWFDPDGRRGATTFILLLSGYLDTALLIFVAIYTCHGLRHLIRRVSTART
jgi:hypothetical protein